MTAAELIAALQRFAPETPVFVDVIDGQAGSIVDVEEASDGDAHELYIIVKEDA